MASYGTPSPPSPSPAPTSQSHESSVNPPVVGQSGPLYQPNVYHPQFYAQYYSQSVPYSYSVQPTVQGTPAPAGPTTSSVPAAPPHSEPSPVPALVPSEEAKPPVLTKRGSGRPRKRPAVEITSGQVGKSNNVTSQSTDTARRPNIARKGRSTGSQNWSARDLIALAHFVEGAVPLGMNVWKRIEKQYNNDYAIPNNRQERGWDNMQDKWYKIVSDGPPTGEGEMPDALNEVFRVNNMLEDVGGLVDPEDLPEVEDSNGTGRAYGGSGAGGNDEFDSNDADYATPAKKKFVTSRPGTDGGSVSISGSSGGGSTTRRMRQSSASLAEKLLSSISPDAEARQNDNRAVMRLYLQQIRAQEETIRVRELQNDALRQEVANLQDKLQSTIRELSRAERRADKLEMRLDMLEMRLDMLEMMGTHHSHSSQRHRAHHKRTLSSSSSSSGSASSSRRSQSPSRSVLKSKRHRVDLQKTLAKGKGKMVYRDKEDEDAAASLMTLVTG